MFIKHVDVFVYMFVYFTHRYKFLSKQERKIKNENKAKMSINDTRLKGKVCIELNKLFLLKKL